MSDKHGDLPRRQYFSVRAGKTAAKNRFDLGDFKRFFLSVYGRLEDAGYFQEWFGYECVDQGFVPGKAGPDLDLFVLRKTHKKNLWPIRTGIQNYSEDDLFDIIEKKVSGTISGRQRESSNRPGTILRSSPTHRAPSLELEAKRCQGQFRGGNGCRQIVLAPFFARAPSTELKARRLSKFSPPPELRAPRAELRAWNSAGRSRKSIA